MQTGPTDFDHAGAWRQRRQTEREGTAMGHAVELSERLIEPVMTMILHTAGAERSLLILPLEGAYWIEIEARAAGEDVAVTRPHAPITGPTSPTNLIRHVIRTRERVVLQDTQLYLFSEDDYLRRRQPHSVLCLPLLRQGALAGLLYLENLSTSLALSSDRMAWLELLAAQAVFSLENSRLYGDLQEQEVKIRRLVESNIIGILISKVEGQILEANDAFLQMLGYDHDDLVSGRMRWTDLTPPEWRAISQAAIVEIQLSGSCKPFEKEYFRKDGRRVPVLVGAAAYDERRTETVAFVVDLTEYKRAGLAARESEERYRDLTDLSPDAIFVIGADGTVVLTNAAGAKLVGCSEDELVGSPFTDTYLPEERHLFQERIEGLQAGPIRFERRFLRRNGELVPVEVSLSALRHGQFQSITRDISERKQAEDEIHRHATQMEALAGISKDLAQVGLDVQAVLDTIARRIAEVIGDGCLIYLFSNDGQWYEQRAFHHARPEIKAAIVSFLPPKQPVSDSTGWAAEILRTGQGVLIPFTDDEQLRQNMPPHILPIVRRFGLVSQLLVPLRVGGRVIGTLSLTRYRPGRPYTTDDQVLVQELADRAALTIQNAGLFEQVQGAHQRLQTMSSQLLVAQEAERRQVARELHDQIGQVLTAVSADLQALEPSPDAVVQAERLEASLQLVDQALEQVRDLSLDLRPALLDDLGLGPALEWYVDRQAQRSGLRTELVIEPDDLRLPPELETTLFRLAQIALTNVVRHAQAKQVQVQISRREDQVELVVRDDGVGFDVPAALERATRGGTLGLVSLQERAQLAGGEVEIHSTPGHGTEIRARFPLE